MFILFFFSLNYVNVNFNLYFTFLDMFSYYLLILSLFFYPFLYLVSYKFFENSNNKYMYMFIMISLFLCIMLSFIVSKGIFFYIFFELSLIPIYFLILGWGYQFERLSASLYMMIYTLSMSLPMLAVLLKSDFLFGDFLFCIKFFNFIVMFIFLPFLIKLPVYFFHLWLPKAHVEAPVVGSMILAGLMLKMGGYGFMRFWGFFPYFHSVFLYYFLGVFLWGSVMSSLLCLYQNDFKSFIAYSSVSHMSLCLIGLMGSSLISSSAFLLVLLSHGFVSSGLFFMSNYMYESTFSRQLKLTRLNRTNTLIFLFFFLFLLFNFGVPPSMNFWSEIMIMIEILNSMFYLNLMMIVLMMMVSIFCLNLFSLLFLGRHWGKIHNISYLSNNINFFFHLIPLVFWFIFSELYQT